MLKIDLYYKNISELKVIICKSARIAIHSTKKKSYTIFRFCSILNCQKILKYLPYCYIIAQILDDGWSIL